MLREKILRKIYFTCLIVFVLFILSSFTINKRIPNIKVEYQSKISSIYLLDDNNYLLKVNISVKDELMDNIPIIINSLKQNYNHYSGLKGIIPVDTKINSIKLDKGILYLDFNKEFLNLNDYLFEKEIESIVYSMLEFKEITGVKITIDNNIIEKYNNILTKDIGINKEYSINSINDIEKE